MRYLALSLAFCTIALAAFSGALIGELASEQYETQARVAAERTQFVCLDNAGAIVTHGDAFSVCEHITYRRASRHA